MLEGLIFLALMGLIILVEMEQLVLVEPFAELVAKLALNLYHQEQHWLQPKVWRSHQIDPPQTLVL